MNILKLKAKNIHNKWKDDPHIVLHHHRYLFEKSIQQIMELPRDHLACWINLVEAVQELVQVNYDQSSSKSAKIMENFL
jgi:hypothetical protein